MASIFPPYHALNFISRIYNHHSKNYYGIQERKNFIPRLQTAKKTSLYDLTVKIGKKVTKYILAVIPGDTMVDFQAVKSLFGSTYVAFASSDVAEQLAGSVAGTILPFSFNDELELLVDPLLLENDEMYFNAARLDRSMVLSTRDYVAVAKPRLGRIAKGR